MKVWSLILGLGLPLAALGQTNYTPYTFATLAGQVGSSGSTGGSGSVARFNNPIGVARDKSGNLYVGDTDNHMIRKISPAGVVTTLAGQAGNGGIADGTGNAALFDRPQGIAVDSAGSIYVADSYFNLIRKVSPAGIVSTLAGIPYPHGGYVDGAGTNAMFNFPVGVAVDSAGNVYVADQGNNRIRKITPDGIVTTLAGANRGYADGVGNAASFNNPRGIAVDSNGNVYVAEYFGQIIRKITTDGVVSTFAGLGNSSFIPLGGYADGTNETAKFNFPTSVALDTAGNLYIGDNNNSLVRKITIVGTNRVVTTIAGLARVSGSADGTGSVARFNGPFGVAVDNAGYVYVADGYNNTVRIGWPASYLHGNLTVTPATTVDFGAIQSGGSANRAFTIVNSGNYPITGNANVEAPFNIVTGGSYTLSQGQSQSVTVRYSPMATGNNSTYVYFTGGGGATRQITGSAFNNPSPTTGTIIGRVTRSDTHAALNGVGISVVGPGANMFNGGSSPGTVTGNSAGQAGSFSISGLTPNAHYHVLATSSGQQFYLAELTDVNVSAGQTTTANIELTPVPTPSQPPTLTPEQTPVVLVRGRGADKQWIENNSSSEWGYWSSFRSALAGQGFTNVWDCNQPDNDPQFPVFSGNGHVINGQNSIEANSFGLEYYIEQKAEQFNRANGFYPPTINIIAHSMGGLITRNAIRSSGIFSFVGSNGKWVSINVNKVVMLGTPNAGTELADSALLDYVPGWPYGWDSTRNLTTSYIQNQFNSAYKWPIGVKLFLLGGGGGPSSSDPELRATSLLMAFRQSTTDGAVPWPSVSGISFGFELYGLTLFSKSTFDGVPAVAPKYEPDLDHYELLSSADVSTWAIAALKGTVANVAMLSKKGPVMIPKDALNSGSNSLPNQQVEQIGTALFANMTNEVSVISDAETTLEFVLLAGDTNVVLRLKDPAGSVIDITTPSSNTNVSYSAVTGASNMLALCYTINNPTAGIWKVDMDGSAMNSTQTKGNLLVFVDSNVADSTNWAAL